MDNRTTPMPGREPPSLSNASLEALAQHQRRKDGMS